MKDVFTDIYKNNSWKDPTSVSGSGSTLEATKYIRKVLPGLLKDLKIKTLLDIPCGDFHWFNKVDYGSDDGKLIYYIGADIVPELIAKNRELYGGYTYRDFRVLDITKDELPKADLVLVRDLFGHFSHRSVKKALNNIKASGAKYLLATTFPEHGTTTQDIEDGQWRPINLESFYGLPDPILYIGETATGEFSDKCLGLWELEE